MAVHVLTGPRQVQCRTVNSSSSVSLTKRPDIVQVQALIGCRQAQRAGTSCHTGSPR